MPLQQLVEYYNDRLEWEHRADFRPFMIEKGRVYGAFGPIRVGSDLSPVREILKPGNHAGYVATLKVAPRETPHLRSHELDRIVSLPNRQSPDIDSVVDFDRLARTVHMLNFLPLSHEPAFLQLEVDPRHILGVKKDHGAYFQEVIGKCGLSPQSIVIALRVSVVYAKYYRALLQGLENYRQRGYRVALKFDYQSLAGSAAALIEKLSPDFAVLSACSLTDVQDSRLPDKLCDLSRLTRSYGGFTAMFEVSDKKTETLARKSGFHLGQGCYYEQSGFLNHDAPPRCSGAK